LIFAVAYRSVIGVAIKVSTFPIVEHIERFGLICFHSGNRLHKHSLGLVGRAELGWLLCESRADESVRTAADAAAIVNARIMDCLPVQRAPAGCAGTC
jgi:hypothetical protein